MPEVTWAHWLGWGVMIVMYLRYKIGPYRVRTRDGYVRVKVGGRRRRELEHRVKAERALRRRLQSFEVVHHRNGRRDDNRLVNLCVMSAQAHIRHHSWLDWYRASFGRYPARQLERAKLLELGGVLFEADL